VSRRAKVAVVVCVGVFLSSLDLFIVNIAFPDLRRDFPDSSLAELSWVLNVYAIVFAALLARRPLGGPRRSQACLPRRVGALHGRLGG
jgi:MFS family permease